MRSRFCATGAALLVCVFSSGVFGQTTQPVSLNIYPTQQLQTITGFGSAVSSSATVLESYAPYQQNVARDLGESMLRVELSYRSVPNKVVFGSDLESNVNLLNWNADGVWNSGKFAQAVNASKLDQLTVMGCIWSPPAWMKLNGSIGAIKQPDGTYKDPNNILNPDPANLQQFARYVAAYVQGLKERYGITLAGVSLQNEPEFSERFQSCVYSFSQYDLAARAITQEFVKDGITTQLVGPDDVGPDMGRFTYALNAYSNAVKNDPIVAPHMIAVTNHGPFGGSMTNEQGLRNAWIDYFNKVKPYKMQFWQSENSGEQVQWLYTDPKGHQLGAFSIGMHLHDALRYGHVNGWLYWQTADGTPESQNSLTQDAVTNASLKYCAAKHYFRFIRPRSIRLNTSADVIDGVNIDAYLNNQSHTITIELLNNSTYDAPVNINIPYPLVLYSLNVYQTDATEHFVQLSDLSLNHGNGSLTLPGYSITTLYGKYTNGTYPAMVAALAADGVTVITDAATAVPEPASATALGLLAVAFLARRPRRAA